MSATIKILILEDDAADRMQFEHCVTEHTDIEIVGCTANAAEALAIARQTNPDAMIIDLELHNGSGNGLQFLSDLKKTPLKTAPYLLITTNNSSHTTHEAARSLGADFILTKYESDYSADYVIGFLKMMHATIHGNSAKEGAVTAKSSVCQNNRSKCSLHDIPETELMEFIRNELLLIGISPKAVGFHYLADAVFIKLQDSHANVYKIIGPKYKRSDPSIERAMQYAINRAWRTGDPDELLNKYTARISADRGVPTIMEFVYFYVSKAQNNFNIK